MIIFRLRELWAESVDELKQNVDTKIRSLEEKTLKTKDDTETIQNLIDQKNCILDELNKVLVQSEDILRVTTSKPGMEQTVPLTYRRESIMAYDSWDTILYH